METQSTQTSEHVLVIDDDVELCNLVSRFLVREGFQIDAVNGGAQGIERALSGDYALVVLDVMMPEMSGFDVLRRIRAESPMPVLMLTARGDALDRVLGLEMGADDYLPKPFSPPELTARIRAILRRAKPATATPGAANSTVTIGDIELDSGARVVRHGHQLVNLTTVEFDLLETLMCASGSP